LTFPGVFESVLICESSVARKARNYHSSKRNLRKSQHFWAKEYHTSTVGQNWEVNSKEIKEQEEEDWRIDQVQIFD
jgi:putative transposase